MKTVVLGGGCFWCTEAIFRGTKGVCDVRSGFSGGRIKNPSYKEVCFGLTGHTEVVKIVYDETIISYEELLLLHLLTHDPTSLPMKDINKAKQYRSVVFYQNEDEKLIAEYVFDKMNRFFKAQILSELDPFEIFYEAEDNHQNFYEKNRDSYYVECFIEPKLLKYKELKSMLTFES